MSIEIFQAIDRRDLDTVVRLIENGADVNFVDSLGEYAGYCPLTLAAEVGDRKIVDALLSAGARNKSFVHDAIHHNHPDIVERWLELGLDVDIVDDTDLITPLIKAAGGSLEIVQMLEAAGANVDAVSSEGTTALSQAKIRGKEEIVEFLWPLSSSATRKSARLIDRPSAPGSTR